MFAFIGGCLMIIALVPLILLILLLSAGLIDCIKNIQIKK